MRVKRCGVAWRVALCALGGIMLAAVPAYALESGPPPWAICAGGRVADEAVARGVRLEPADGTTVTAGTPVTFSGESNHPLTFSVASSEALLSSPDIDSGTGSQSGAFYTFTSTKSTATPRTIYWTASFTLTPEDCETPSTFTTPVRTLVITPSAAELAAAKRQQEEAAAKKKSEEEPASTGSVSLDETTIDVQSTDEAAVKLACTGAGACAGKMTLTVKSTKGGRGSRRGKKSSNPTATIGSARFSISAGKTAVVKLALNATGRALLKADHKRLTTSLTIFESSSGPSRTYSKTVQLLEHGRR
jgi:hypothetical protein